MTTCNICTEKYNKTNHSPIECLYCQFTACRSCCETYLTNERTPKCMNNECEKTWTRKFLVAQFTKKFINTNWKAILEALGLEREKALLPATQGIVEQIIERENIQHQITDLDKLINDLYRQRNALQTHYHHLGTNNPSITGERRHFTRACPAEDCRGFLSTQWKCGLCSQWTCNECHVVKGPRNDSPHTCDPEHLETAKLLNKDTKPCPKCGTGIYKIEGCDQMWCTQCHTAFSWRTGRIETHIHNPHYYEWQRRTNNGVIPRNVGDFQCGQEITHHTALRLGNIIRDVYLENGKDRTYIPNPRYTIDRPAHLSQTPVMDELCQRIDCIVRTVLHLQRVQMPNYQVDQETNNQQLRIDYLRNRITENEFKIKVQRAIKSHDKKREIGEIIHLFIQTVTDILYRLHDTVRNTEPCVTIDQKDNLSNEIHKLLNEINPLLEYTSECFVEIAKTYGCKERQLRMFGPRDRYRDVLVIKD